MKFYYGSDLHLTHFLSNDTVKLRSWTRKNLIKEDSKTSTIVIAGDVSEYLGHISALLNELRRTPLVPGVLVFCQNNIYIFVKSG